MLSTNSLPYSAFFKAGIKMFSKKCSKVLLLPTVPKEI
jgi:hypothetical protein